MKKYDKRFFGLLALLLTGCASMNTTTRFTQDEREIFTLKLQSDPPGARVIQEWKGQRRVLGATPLDLSMVFEHRKQPGFLGDIGLKSWQPEQNEESVWVVEERLDNYYVDLKGISLIKKGYEPETVKFPWRIPTDLTQRNIHGQDLGRVDTEKEKTVVMRSPVAPELTVSMTLQTPTGPATVYKYLSDGSEGSELFQLPIKTEIGYARVRDESGKVLKYRWWSKNPLQTFRFMKDGSIQFSGVLKQNGFDPEPIFQQKIYQAGANGETNVVAGLRLTTPSEKQAVFKLSVDSLPSEASVFVLREDGTLGKKLGQTPFELKVGLAQQQQWDPESGYVHKDWLLWAPTGLVQWEKDENGITDFYLSCALYRDGFATEKLRQKIFTLTPGKPFPAGKTLTVPLLHPEQAAAREANQSRKTIEKPTPAPAPVRQPYVWKAPVEQEPNPEPLKKEKSTSWKDRLFR